MQDECVPSIEDSYNLRRIVLGVWVILMRRDGKQLTLGFVYFGQYNVGI